ncbi:hypothetical protein [Paenibacillus sp. YIM B09110]|uniref:hypothetical protein n=1 Tax=Paenibacillus sp. YIM B09110 TaxID=3126102 RepID=UPI00301CFDC2
MQASWLQIGISVDKLMKTIAMRTLKDLGLDQMKVVGTTGLHTRRRTSRIKPFKELLAKRVDF